MITDYFRPEIEAHDLEDICSIKIACHTAFMVLLLNFKPVNWPSRSCDIIPLDFFLSGYVESKSSTSWLQLRNLEANISRVIREIPLEMHERITNLIMDHVSHSYGQYLKEINL